MPVITVTLLPVRPDLDLSAFADGPLQEVLAATLAYYKAIGFQEPWVSYLAQQGGAYCGCCSFKGRPAGSRVEIAYYTFPSFEGKGVASEMCRQLTALALAQDAGLAVTARTLPEENASTAILKKNGFRFSGIVNDPEDGEVFEWVFHSR